MVNLPNSLTLLRVAMIPLLVVVFYLPWKWHALASAALFGLAALTDWADGYLARKLNQTSAFGAFLDPVADKFLICAALLCLLHLNRVDALVAFVIIGREIAISALREWMAQIGASRSVAVHMLGKIKTATQMVAIPFLLFDGALFGVIDTRLWGTGLIWLASKDRAAALIGGGVVLSHWFLDLLVHRPDLTLDQKLQAEGLGRVEAGRGGDQEEVVPAVHPGRVDVRRVGDLRAVGGDVEPGAPPDGVPDAVQADLLGALEGHGGVEARDVERRAGGLQAAQSAAVFNRSLTTVFAEPPPAAPSAGAPPPWLQPHIRSARLPRWRERAIQT